VNVRERVKPFEGLASGQPATVRLTAKHTVQASDVTFHVAQWIVPSYLFYFFIF
jgi:hypothetical protein